MNHNSWETVWSFATDKFTVKLQLSPEDGYQYDGDDPDGETQAKIDSGEYIAFESRVVVMANGKVIGSDYLGGSVYDASEVDQFWTSHRTSSAEYRNTLAQKAKNICICHYFPDMVRIAIADARKTLQS